MRTAFLLNVDTLFHKFTNFVLNAVVHFVILAFANEYDILIFFFSYSFSKLYCHSDEKKKK